MTLVAVVVCTTTVLAGAYLGLCAGQLITYYLGKKLVQ